MADEFSIEDILKEYSGKTVPESFGETKEPASITEENLFRAEKQSENVTADTGEIPVSAPVSENEPSKEQPETEKSFEGAPVKSHASEETIGLHVKLGVKAQGIEESVAPEAQKDSHVEDMSITQLVNKAVEDIEQEDGAEAENKSATVVVKKMKKPEEAQNQQIIKEIQELKEQSGDTEDGGENAAQPVNRAKPEDINMELTDKIIPETAQLDAVRQASEAEKKSREELKEQRKKKVEQFVLEDKPEEKEEQTQGDGDYESFDETDQVASDIEQLRHNLFLRFVVLLVTGLAAGYISVANDFSLPILKIFDRNTSPGGFAFTLTLLGLAACFVAYNVIFSGIKNLISLKADSDSISVLSIAAAVVSGIVLLVDDDLARGSNFHLYIAAAILSLMMNTLGKILIVSRTERNFKYVSGDYEKYAVTSVDDEEAAIKFTNGAVNDYPCLATMKKTEFVKDFLKNSYSADIADSYSKKFAPFMAIGSVVIAVIGMLLDKNASGFTGNLVSFFSILAGTLSLCSAVALMLVVNVPLARASKKYLESSGVMLGYSSVEDFADTNSVLVGVEQLFPEGRVELVNLKTMSTTMVEECILLAASLACQAGSVLKPTFYKILKGKTEMLYPVESYIYEDGLGLSGWIENKRVLLGTRELMENHSIQGIPSPSKEKEYAKGNLVLYLSISGVVSSLFVIRAKGSANVSKWLRELEKQNITVILRSVDSFISLNFLSQTFGVSPDLFKLMPFRDYKEYDKQTSYVPKMSASMICSGHFQSLAMLLCGAKKIQLLSYVGITIQMASAILGGVIALIMALLGSFSQLSASVVLCYNLVWLAATLISQQLRKL